MLVHCNTCSADVEAKIIGSYVEDDEQHPISFRHSMLECPRCHGPLLVQQSDLEGTFDADTPMVLYPLDVHRHLGAVPMSIRTAFDEAVVCFKAKAYTASAIMCRKVLEGLCAEHHVREKNLEQSIKKLKETGIIEARLFEWAEALRVLGNEAVHGVSTTISRDDTRDILEFTQALAEYVFTYRDRFEAFKKRREKIDENGAG